MIDSKTMKDLDILKKAILKWTGGLPIEGDTKEELKSSLKSRHWDLECELNQQAESFYCEIDKLDIPEH